MPATISSQNYAQYVDYDHEHFLEGEEGIDYFDGEGIPEEYDEV